jgi:hypothetical protein
MRILQQKQGQGFGAENSEAAGPRLRFNMEENMVKITIPLPEDNLARAATESVWAEPEGDGTYKVKNVPFFAKGISCNDVVQAEPQDGALVFKKIVRRGGHSTYRIYSKSDRRSPEVLSVLQTLEKMHCDIEPATDKIVGVDVLPEADIYRVYQVLEDAERSGTFDFQEGYCGHPLKPKL